jgi:putative DNA primase/helicase
MPLDDGRCGPRAGEDSAEAKVRSASVLRQAQDSPDPALLEPLFGLGLEFLELHVPEASRTTKTGKVVRLGKAPVRKRWTEGPAGTDADACGWMAGGSNVGVRLRDRDLVVDVDPRNGGDASLKRLLADLGLDLRMAFPWVETGSGGLHIYMAKPADLRTASKLAAYPGVEFKTRGTQVVAPGSLHPDTRRHYQADLLSDFSAIPAAPEELLGMLGVQDIVWPAEAGQRSPEELHELLGALDVTAYSEQSEWLALMMACHFATAGAGREEFVAWSIGDPDYAHDEEVIRYRWDSLRLDHKRPVAAATLYKHVIDAGRGDLMRKFGAADDFAGVEVDVGDLPVRETRPEAEAPLSCVAPMSLARKMLSGKALIRSNGDWLRYDRERNSYVEEPSEAFAARVWNWTDGRPYRKDDEVKTLVAGKELVANVTAAATAQRQGPRDLPTWHPREAGDPDPADLLPVQNGLLNLTTMELLAPTPRFLTRNASPVAYAPSAPRPGRWTRFLAEVFLGDHEARDTLQEVVGYLLTQDTSQQKIFCLVGPPRSGKGTINRVIQLLLGEGNYTSPTAANLARGDFGLQRLIGRQLATISDMRMGRNADPAALAENLLRISGEDEVSIDRKFKDAWEGKLPTRFLLNSNETPQFKDTSGAIISRLILMRSLVSFLGKEDPGLMHELRAELPGILNWALEGLLRLRARGYFVQPSSSRAELAAMVALASPVKAFAEERLQQSAETATAKLTIWKAFEDWTAEVGLPYSGNMSHFFKDLKTVGLAFTDTRPHINGVRVGCVQGLALLPD